MVHYNLVKITINTSHLAEVKIDVIVWHHSIFNSIMTNKGSLFIFKFWSLLCYLFGIKQQLSTAFHLQTNGQTERQNNIIKAYLRAFVNIEQNN